MNPKQASHNLSNARTNKQGMTMPSNREKAVAKHIPPLYIGTRHAQHSTYHAFYGGIVAGDERDGHVRLQKERVRKAQ